MLVVGDCVGIFDIVDVELGHNSVVDKLGVAEVGFPVGSEFVGVHEEVALDDEGLRAAVVDGVGSLGSDLVGVNVAVPDNDADTVLEGVMELVIPGARDRDIVVDIVGELELVGGEDAVTDGEEPVEREADGSGERVAASVGRTVSVAVLDADAPGPNELVGVSDLVIGGDCDSDVVAETVCDAVLVNDGVEPTDRLAVMEGVLTAVSDADTVIENDVLIVFDGDRVLVLACVPVIEIEAPILTEDVDVSDRVGENDVETVCEGVNAKQAMRITEPSEPVPPTEGAPPT